MKNLLAPVFLFIHIFSFQWSFLPFSNTVILFFTSFVYTIYYIISKKNIVINWNVLIFIISSLLVFVIAFCSNAINLSGDYSQLKIIIVFLVVYGINSFFIIKFFMSEWGFDKLIICFVYVLLIQFFLSLFISFSEPVRNFYISNVSIANPELMEGFEGQRLIGLGSGYFNLGTIFSFGVVFIAYYLNIYEVTRTKFIFLTVSFVLLAIGAMFAARTGIVGVIVGFLLLFSKFRPQVLHFIFTILIIIISLLFIILIILPVERIDFIIDYMLPWAFEIFYNIFLGDSIATSSTDSLITMYFMPDNLKTILIGDARLFVEGGYYMGTDAGYVRQIFSYGLIGLMASLSLYFYMFYFISMRVGFSFAAAMLFMILIYNIKGTFLFISSFDSVLVLIFLFFALNYNTKNKYIKVCEIHKPVAS